RKPDDSKNGLWQSLLQTEIFLGFDHVSHVPEYHDLSRRVRSRVSTPGNRNPRRKDQAGAVAGIYRPRTFDFEDVARECVRNQSRSCGGNERASLTDSLIIVVSCEKRNCRPLTSILSPRRRGEAERRTGIIISAVNPMTEWNTKRLIAADRPSPGDTARFS